jgi:hypothetical protein
MSDDYLWNRSGAPDPEVVRLERVLGELRHRARPLALPPAKRQPRSRAAWRRYAVPLALAATVALMVAGTWQWRPRPATDSARSSGAAPVGPWTVAPVRGTPTLALAPVNREAPVPADGWLETDASSSARLSAGEVGHVDVGPGSRVRVVTAGPGEHRLALVRGRLDAFIWASPGQFFVETPSAVAIDLGCAYTLEVDPDGAGRLRVTVGWVGFELNGRESLVPAGAVCATRPGRGPGTPHFEDAAPGFIEGLARLDAGQLGARAALDQVLKDARPRDALSLWHLLSRLDESAAGPVYDRLATIAPPPRGVTKELALARDQRALDAWWDSFGLGEAAYFRLWMKR